MLELRNTQQTQIMILKSIAPLNKFVDAELGVVVSKRADIDLVGQSHWLTQIMLDAHLIGGDHKEGYSITSQGQQLLSEQGSMDEQWQYVVDNWAAQYYLDLAERFKDSDPGSPKEIIYQRASANHTFHHNRLNKITE